MTDESVPGVASLIGASGNNLLRGVEVNDDEVEVFFGEIVTPFTLADASGEGVMCLFTPGFSRGILDGVKSFRHIISVEEAIVAKYFSRKR